MGVIGASQQVDEPRFGPAIRGIDPLDLEGVSGAALRVLIGEVGWDTQGEDSPSSDDEVVCDHGSITGLSPN